MQKLIQPQERKREDGFGCRDETATTEVYTTSAFGKNQITFSISSKTLTKNTHIRANKLRDFYEEKIRVCCAWGLEHNLKLMGAMSHEKVCTRTD